MWEEVENKLHKNYTFKTFEQARVFLEQVARLAKQHQHHPEVYNVYNKVELRLNTHDAGGIVTDKDRNLAQAIDGILKTKN